jgi:hypothetical protein
MAEVRRLKLHEELCELLGSRQVYYQPPASLMLKYPCIVYSKAGIDRRSANDRLYRMVDRYEVVLIEHDPDSDLVDRTLIHFPMCSLDRLYVADNLYHKSLTLYF